MHAGVQEHRTTVDARAYRMMAETEERHWWWSGRRAILDEVIASLYARGGLPRGRLYDLGCGVGSNLDVLGRYGEAVGYDGSDLAVEAAHERGRTGVRFADLSRGEDALPECEPGSGAVVLLADVIEHLDDEGPALALAHRLLAPGGALIITVPAFPFLWGASDEFNHHRRRYTRETLRRVVSTRFDVERLTYFNFFLFGPIAAARSVSRLLRRPGQEEIGLPPNPVNTVLASLFSAESQLLKQRDLPFGVSLLCVGRKAR